VSWRSAAKQALKPVLGPLLARLYVRVDHRVDGRVDPRVDQRVHELEQQSAIKRLAEHLPALIEAISTLNAATREVRRSEVALASNVSRIDQVQVQQSETIADIWGAMSQLAERIKQVEERGEFIRRELLVTMRYQEGTASRGATEIVESKVLAPEKLADLEDLRLNLGCGHIPLDGYVNVDSRELPGVDVLADVRHLPFDPDTVNEIYGAHLLEHFPLDELERVVLPSWRRVLRPGGTLRLVVPDSGAMLDEYAGGRLSFEDLRLVTYGDQEYDGDFHFTMFTAESLAELLNVAGFDDVEVLETGRPNGACLEMEVRASKPTP
jgi:predicted SAM-dependent methyltransferase